MLSSSASSNSYLKVWKLRMLSKNTIKQVSGVNRIVNVAI